MICYKKQYWKISITPRFAPKNEKKEKRLQVVSKKLFAQLVVIHDIT